MLNRLVFLRHTKTGISKHLDINIRSRLWRAGYWLLVLSLLHAAAMWWFEKLAPADALWLTLTTLTTVGYGDFSAQTPLGRLATVVLLYGIGISLLAQLASDYIDFRIKQKEDRIKGRWRWRMQDHILIINSPAQSPARYFRRLVEQLRASPQYAETPVQILTDAFPDGLPRELREMGVVHYHADVSDPEALSAVDAHQARVIVILARDEHNRISDSVTLDTLMQLNEMTRKSVPYTVAECVEETNRPRLRHAGANATLRPVRSYPEILVRSLVAPGTEQVLENLFTHHDDHAMRYDIPLRDAIWSDVVCELVRGGEGTLVAYVDQGGEVESHPAPDHRFDAQALILIVREDAVPTDSQLRERLRPWLAA